MKFNLLQINVGDCYWFDLFSIETINNIYSLFYVGRIEGVWQFDLLFLRPFVRGLMKWFFG